MEPAIAVVDQPGEAVVAERACDLSIVCPTCDLPMEPEHAHYRCPRCGYRDSCCM